MASFGQIAKGTRARKRIQLPMGAAQFDPEIGTWGGGEIVDLDVRPINAVERSLVLERSRAFAKSKGVEDPTDGDELYDQARLLHTLAIACVDKDSPESDPKPFFDGGFEQLHTTELLTTDHIAYLFEQQQLWEDECSPRLKKQTPGQFMATILSIAGGDMSFFVGARPGMLWSFTRTLAALHANSLTPTSPSSSDSAPSTH